MKRKLNLYFNVLVEAEDAEVEQISASLGYMVDRLLNEESQKASANILQFNFLMEDVVDDE